MTVLEEREFEYAGDLCSVKVIEEESKLKRLRWNTVIVESEDSGVSLVDRETTSRYRAFFGWRDARSYDIEEHIENAIEDFKEKVDRTREDAATMAVLTQLL